MKKFLVLTLVCVFATMASAGLETAINDVVFEGTAIAAAGDVLSLAGLEAVETGMFAGPWYVIGEEGASVSGAADLTGAMLPGIIELADGYQLSVSALFSPIAAGKWFTMDIGGETGKVVIYGADDNGDLDPTAVIGTVLVPEPMSIALLGLGGLFLRRRK